MKQKTQTTTVWAGEETKAPGLISVFLEKERSQHKNFTRCCGQCVTYNYSYLYSASAVKD